MPVEFPAELLEQFQKTSFCPTDFCGRVENGISWNTLRAETYPWTEQNYGGCRMYYDFHDRDGVHPASQPFADWGGEHDGEFVKAVIDWLQSMTAAKNGST